jgi:hypothetical protein
MLALVIGSFVLHQDQRPTRPQLPPPPGDVTVTIDSDNGVWHVMRNGRDLGPTPMMMLGKQGEEVTYTLSRPGCPDVKKTFQMPAVSQTFTEHPPCGGQ